MHVVTEKSENEMAAGVLSKQIDLLYINQTFAIVITILVVAVTFLYLSVKFGWSEFGDCLLMFTVGITLRSFSSYQYYKSKSKETINLENARLLYLIGVVAMGLFWSVYTIKLFPLLGTSDQLLLLLIITGFATGSQTTMGFLKLPVISFILLLFLPLTFAIFISDFPDKNNVVVVVIVYAAFIVRSALILYKNTYDMLLLQELSIDREKELFLQKEKANSANLAKSEFLSRMSHELRTPLNAILGFTELQQRDKSAPLSDKQALRAQKTADAGKHLLSIVNDVLDFSRIETGSIDIKIEATDLSHSVIKSIRLVEEKASVRNISVFFRKDKNKNFVLADEKRLNQIIVNLLDNAIKYNKLGGDVLISTETSDDNRIRLYVADTGFGLQSENIDDLFTPFSRLGAESLGIDGTGIGLSLCKEFIELMGGKIGVDKFSDQGCRFWIELPHIESAVVLDNDNTVEKLPLSNESVKHVLLVEDNLVNSEVAVDMLAEINIQADVAYNGEQAIDMFEENTYSLILMDCEMPVMDGFLTTEKLRMKEKELQQTRIPIIALTAHAISGARGKCIASGMDDFLSKPFTMATLHSTLYKWFDIDVLDHGEEKNMSEESENNKIVRRNDTATNTVFRCDSSILDCNIVKHLFDKQSISNENFLSKMVDIYLKQSSGLLADLRVATKNSDVEAIRRITHTLKSSSVNVGAVKLSEICRDIEQSCNRGVIHESVIERLYISYAESENALLSVIGEVTTNGIIVGGSNSID